MSDTKGMSVVRLLNFSDSIKEMTYKEMTYVANILQMEINAYDGNDYAMADVLWCIADEISDEFYESKKGTMLIPRNLERPLPNDN